MLPLAQASTDDPLRKAAPTSCNLNRPDLALLHIQLCPLKAAYVLFFFSFLFGK